jgi:hypothetical protein
MEALAHAGVRPRRNRATSPALMAASYTRISSSAQSTLYKHIVDSCRSEGATHKSVVFDLDGTLLDNRPRTLVIFRELAELWQSRAPVHAKRLAHATVDELAYLSKDSLTKLGVEEPELAKEAEAFWQARFFTDAYLKYDRALPGAVDFVKACFDRGANLVYFTGRDLPKMALGSFESLRDCGFPIGVSGTSLVLKPTFEMPDEVYKRTFGPQLVRSGPVVASFDNEPGNCNTLHAQYPNAQAVFLDTQHLPGAPALHPNVHVVPDFIVHT